MPASLINSPQKTTFYNHNNMTKLSIPAFIAAALLIAGLSKCGLPRATAPPTAPHLVTAGNITVARQEVRVVWERASVLLVLSTAEQVGRIELCRDGSDFRTPAHCYAEYPAGWFADWGHNGDHLRVFANGHAEGRVNGKDIYFTPLGSGQCFPE